MSVKVSAREARTLDQIKEHYEIEKELASRLRNSHREERKHLYTSLYDELFLRVPYHSQLTRKASSQATVRAVKAKMKLLKSFLKPEITFLEVGSGDCSLSFEVARQVKEVFAIDVSEEVAKSSDIPENFKLIISDGCSIPVPENSIDVAYSNQLMEHLHPEDAFEQLQNIYRALAPGGIYICITPNRISGPHDISKYFDKVATGFHLKEYTVTELSQLFYDVGFSKVKICLNVKYAYIKISPVLSIACEKFLNSLPTLPRRKLAKVFPIKRLIKVQLIGNKRN